MLLEVAVISTKPQKLNSFLPHCSYCDGDRNSLDLNCPSRTSLITNHILYNPFLPQICLLHSNFPDCKSVGTNHSLFRYHPLQWQLPFCFSLFYNIFRRFAGASIPLGRGRLADYFSLHDSQIKWFFHCPTWLITAVTVAVPLSKSDSKFFLSWWADFHVVIVTCNYLTFVLVRWYDLDIFHNILVVFEFGTNT